MKVVPASVRDAALRALPKMTDPCFFPPAMRGDKMAKAAKSEPTEVCWAVLTLKGAGEWTPEGRKIIAEWLRQKAKDLIKDGANYAPRFRARYMSVKP